jgi:hypothetical protein
VALGKLGISKINGNSAATVAPMPCPQRPTSGSGSVGGAAEGRNEVGGTDTRPLCIAREREIEARLFPALRSAAS